MRLLSFLICVAATTVWFITAAVSTVHAEANQPSVDSEGHVSVLYSSTLWIKHKHSIHGEFRVERRGEKLFLVLGDSFQTKKGPDLKLVLSPQPLEKANKNNALNGGVVLGVFTRFKGRSEFEIPRDTDLVSVRSLLIHCEKFNVLWGGVTFQQGEVIGSASDWTKKNGKTQGRVEIAHTSDGIVLRLGPGFKTKKAPDLRIALSPHSPRSANDSNALDGSSTPAQLVQIKGTQAYVLPVDEPRNYHSVLIHCEAYSKLWAVTPVDWKPHENPDAE